MRKRWLLVLLPLVPVAAVLLAIGNFNAYLRDNRDWLAQQATARLGRSVEFDALGISLRDGLAARVTGVSIGDDPAFGAESFLRVARADVVVRILPALFGRYEIRRIVLDAPQIKVIRGPQGFNFTSIGAPPARPPAAARMPAEAAARPIAGLPLLVSRLRVKNGRVRFVDRTTVMPEETVIERLDFSAAEVSLDRPVAIAASAAFLGAREQNVRVAGSVGPLGDLKSLSSAPLDLEVSLGPLVIDRLKANALAARFVPLRLSSSDPIDLAVQLAGHLAAPRALVRLDASAAAVSYGGHLRKARGVELSVALEAQWRAGALEVGKLDLRLARAHLSGRGRIGREPAERLDFELSGSGIPLDGWESIAPVAAPFEVGGALDLQVRATGGAGGGELPALNGTIALREARWVQSAGLRVEGFTTEIALRGDRAEIPPTDFELNGKPVRVAATVVSLRDRAAVFSFQAPELSSSARGAAAGAEGPMELARDVDVRGDVRSAGEGLRAKLTVRSTSGSVRDVRYTDLTAVAILQSEKVTLERLSLSAFGGNLVGSGTYARAPRAAPAFSFRGAINGMDLAALTARFARGGAVQMTGKLHAELEVRGRGADWESAKQELAGDGVARVEGGVLRGVNLADEALRGITGVKGLSGLISPSLRKKYPAVFAGEDTVFETLEGRVTLANGIAAIDKVVLAAPDYRLKGRGTIGLDNTVDVGARFTASRDLTRDLLGAAGQLEFLTDGDGHFEVPVKVEGSLPSLHLRPDAAYLAGRLTGALVQSGIEEGLNALIGKKKRGAAAPDAPPERDEKPAELIRKGLEGLFGNGRKERQNEGGK